jgi:hypothetical protein
MYPTLLLIVVRAKCTPRRQTSQYFDTWGWIYLRCRVVQFAYCILPPFLMRYVNSLQIFTESVVCLYFFL